LFEEKFLADSMNSLTQQQWQQILLGIKGFPLLKVDGKTPLKFDYKKLR
jgi:hypothetical protein